MRTRSVVGMGWSLSFLHVYPTKKEDYGMTDGYEYVCMFFCTIDTSSSSPCRKLAHHIHYLPCVGYHGCSDSQRSLSSVERVISLLIITYQLLTNLTNQPTVATFPFVSFRFHRTLDVGRHRSTIASLQSFSFPHSPFPIWDL
jgi:hypothetical protein